MEFTPKPCPAPGCYGYVNLEARGYDLMEVTCSGWCNHCGQKFEAELVIEPGGDLLPVEPVTNPKAWR